MKAVPATMRVARIALAAGAVLSLVLAKRAHAQQNQPDSTLVNALSAGEADAEPKTRKLVKWNEFDGKYLTFRFGGGFLVDYATYSQDSASKEQVTLEPGSCDPHGLGFYKGAFIGCDAGHHPGWPDKDGPGVGWIFRIELT